jgi:hypothetical protein
MAFELTKVILYNQKAIFDHYHYLYYLNGSGYSIMHVFELVKFNCF